MEKISFKVLKVVLVQCNIVDNQYQWKSEVLYTFTHSKSYAYLLNVEPSNLVFLKTCNTEFDEIVITLTDQNGKPLEIEDEDNLIFAIREKSMKQIQKTFIGYCYKKGLDALKTYFWKIAHKTAKAKEEFTGKYW